MDQCATSPMAGTAAGAGNVEIEGDKKIGKRAAAGEKEFRCGAYVVTRDEYADRNRFLLVDGFAPDATFSVISIEDLIADRMGQYASGSAPKMLGQARALLRLHPDVDMAYLDKRVRFESAGDYGADDVEG